MGLESAIICRKKVDQEAGKPWICKCPWCNKKREDGRGRQDSLPGEIKGDKNEGEEGA